MTLTKKTKIIIIASVAAVVLAGLIVMTVLLATRGKDESAGAVAFTRSEYVMRDGDRLEAKNAERFCVVGRCPDGVTLSADGKLAVDNDVATDGVQFKAGAVSGYKVKDTAVVTVRVPAKTPTVAFDNLSDYIINGERVSASTTPLRSVSYSLKNSVAGVSVDQVTGAVFFAASVADGTEFTVVAKAGGVESEKTFYASVGIHVTADKSVAIVEYGVGGEASFTLDYGEEDDAKETGVLGVRLAGTLLGSDGYVYDKDAFTVDISSAALKNLPKGDNSLDIYTARNTVSVTVKSARYVKTAEDLAAINDSVAALADTYVMVEDIDLTEYLSGTAEGWLPIGLYQNHEIPDGTEEALAFRGTFDGNGHTVSGLWTNRSDNNAFNAGLFGFVANTAEIKNLRVVGHKSLPMSVKSFSGVLAGRNKGIIRNCVAEATLMPVGADKIGAFAGCNDGSIYDSYAIVDIDGADGATNVGAFVGENAKGEILRCYSIGGELAFVGGENLITRDCAAFETADEFEAGADLSAWSGWITGGGLPALPSVDVDYEITAIHITNTETQCVIGDTLVITVTGEPAELFSYNSLVFSVIEGDGVTVGRDGTVKTASASAGRCTVMVKCGALTETFTFDIISE